MAGGDIIGHIGVMQADLDISKSSIENVNGKIRKIIESFNSSDRTKLNINVNQTYLQDSIQKALNKTFTVNIKANLVGAEGVTGSHGSSSSTSSRNGGTVSELTRIKQLQAEIIRNSTRLLPLDKATSEARVLSSQIEKMRAEMNALVTSTAEKTGETTAKIREQVGQSSQVVKATNAHQLAVEKLRDKYQNLSTKITEIKGALAGLATETEKIQGGKAASNPAVSSYLNQYKTFTAQLAAYDKLEANGASMSEKNIAMQKLVKSYSSLVTAKKKAAQVTAQEEKIEAKATQTKELNTQETERQTAAVQKNVSVEETALGSFANLLKTRFSYYTGFLVVTAAYSALRKLYDNIVELDTAMTELRKVTDETSAVYNRFLTSAAKNAERLGVSMTDLVSATADFARLGYNINDAAELAQVATVYKHVGDGIEDIGDASESIISTMKAFNIEAKDAMLIVDKFNETGKMVA